MPNPFRLIFFSTLLKICIQSQSRNQETQNHKNRFQFFIHIKKSIILFNSHRSIKHNPTTVRVCMEVRANQTESILRQSHRAENPSTHFLHRTAKSASDNGAKAESKVFDFSSPAIATDRDLLSNCCRNGTPKQDCLHYRFRTSLSESNDRSEASRSLHNKNNHAQISISPFHRRKSNACS